MKAALDRGANVDGLPDIREDENVSPLDVAASEGKLEIVRLLLDHGANIDLHDGWATPLSAAAENDRVEVVKLLIARGATINEDEGSYALWRAAMDGKVAAVRVLLSYGANPNSYMVEGSQKMTLLQAVEESPVEESHHSEVAAALRQAGAK